MDGQIVYIKAEQDIQVAKKKVLLKDIVTLQCADKDLEYRLKQSVFFTFPQEKQEKVVFSIIRVIETILSLAPGAQVDNLGETDFILEYVPKKQNKKWWEWTKTIAVCFTVLIGAAFTIMTFNEDASVGDVFRKFYVFVSGSAPEGTGVIEIAYAIGLPVGIIVFYNHVSKLKIDTDPTPLQVQMRNYEKDVNGTIIENASREGKEREE